MKSRVENMIPIALAFLAAGVFVLKTRRPSPRSCDRSLFRVDEVVISAVLFVLGTSLLVAGILHTR